MASEPPNNPTSGRQYQGLEPQPTSPQYVPQTPPRFYVPDLSEEIVREIPRDHPLKAAGLKEAEYDPRKKHDEVRARISYILVGLLALILVASFVVLIITFYLKDPATAWGNAKDLLQVLIPTLTTLIGSIVGFYFGSQSQGPSDRRS